jgi:hypothetical protein
MNLAIRPKGRSGAEQIVTMLRQIEVLQGQGIPEVPGFV